MTMILDLYSEWHKIIYTQTSSTGDLINEDEFLPAINKIFSIYKHSSIIPAASVTNMINYISENLTVLAMFFTGRSHCKGLAIMVKSSACNTAWKGLIDNYFKSA